jgi:hypothetical protein
MVVYSLSINNSDNLSENCQVKRTCLQPVPEEDVLSSALEGASGAEAKRKLGHMELAATDFTHLWYCQDRSDDFRDSHNNLSFVAGMHVHCPAFVDIMSGREEQLGKHIKFTVKPPLPEGLTLDRRSGLISGIACDSQNTSSTHLITVGVCVTGKGGIRNGMLPLATCTIHIAIEDTQELFQYFISNGISC